MRKKNITHENAKGCCKQAIELLKTNLKAYPSNDVYKNFSKDKCINILEELAMFPMGSFFIINRGVNGFWTDYILNYPNTFRSNLNINSNNEPLTTTEEFILRKAPLTLAHRERYKIFQKLIEEKFENGTKLMSVPCGCMRDILEIQYDKSLSLELVGVDIDKETLKEAEKIAQANELENVCTLECADAWSLKYFEYFDIVASNGLNVYESDVEKLKELYQVLYNSIKPNGHLIMGFLTHPLGTKKCEWNLDKINPSDLDYEILLYSKILGAKWLNYKSSDEIKSELLEIGFKEIKIFYDQAKIFPVVLAKK